MFKNLPSIYGETYPKLVPIISSYICVLSFLLSSNGYISQVIKIDEHLQFFWIVLLPFIHFSYYTCKMYKYDHYMF